LGKLNNRIQELGCGRPFLGFFSDKRSGTTWGWPLAEKKKGAIDNNFIEEPLLTRVDERVKEGEVN